MWLAWLGMRRWATLSAAVERHRGTAVPTADGAGRAAGAKGALTASPAILEWYCSCSKRLAATEHGPSERLSAREYHPACCMQKQCNLWRPETLTQLRAEWEAIFGIC